MKSYLKDIGTVSLLTAKQEVELAKRIQDLMYLDGVRATLAEELEREPSEFEWAIAANIQEEELERRLEDGKRAKNQMIQANLRLVVSIAKRYANKSMSFQDLIQEGCVGLIRGAEKFDFEARVQVQHVRALVDSPGGDAFHQRPVQDHSSARTPVRDHLAHV